MRLVMVLDDNAVDAMQVERALAESRPDAVVITRMSAKAALRLLESSEALPDLLFVDVQLDPSEGIDGFQFVAMARQITHIPTVLMSGAVDDRMRAQATAMGGTPLIAKPMHKLEWIRKVGATCTFFWDVAENSRPHLYSEPYDTESPALSSQRITPPPPTPDADDWIDIDWDGDGG